MALRSIATAGMVAAALALSAAAAEAAPGRATGAVNMRTGPGTGYARITTIPAGARIQVYDCGSWCRVTYAGRSGWVSAGYVATGGPRMRPGVQRGFRAPPPTFGYARKPWWDDRNNAWYDGRRWYFNGRWYDRPSGFSFGFGFSG
jgi:uncharacterized protein YraI